MLATGGRTVWAILMKKDIDYAELISFLACLMWSAVQIAFDPVSVNPGQYSFLISIADSVTFDINELRYLIIGVFALIGVLQLWAVSTNNWKWRRWTAMAGASTWSFLFMGLILGEYRATVPYFTLLIALSEGWAYLRLRVI